MVVRIVILRDADQTARKFSAEDLPPSIRNNIEGDLLSFVKTMHPGAFDRLMCTKTSLPPCVEPLHDSLRHITLPFREV